jgi:hypothetical protein
MLSYKKLFSSVDSAVYNRGIRLYLDGAVGNPRSMLLDNWREYTVVDNANKSYLVKIPLLHLTMSVTKISKASEALLEVASCECVFFGKYNYCKHLVAVCASLDKEFNFFEIPNIQSEVDILDNIFSAQKLKQHRKWLEVIDTLLTRDTENYFYLDKISQALKAEPDQHSDFLNELHRLLQPIMGNYSSEKRLVKIIQESILIGQGVWLDFWNEYFSKFDEYNQVNLFFGLWKIFWLNQKSGFGKKLESVFSSASKKVKKGVLEKLKEEFHLDNRVWLEYCFSAKYFDWFNENLNFLDPLTLIRFAQIYPDKVEQVEILVFKQIKIWSDYLQTGEYEMVIDVFKNWAKRLGKSDLYVDALNYFRNQHPRKKKLLNQLD